MGEACAPAIGDRFATKISPMATIAAIDVKELRRRLDADGAKPYLLDVREPWEYLAGHVPGAQLIPLGELEQRVAEVPRDREVLAICHSGQRSLAAAGYLQQLGYTKVSNVDGGTAAWIERGYPTEGSSAS
jgi:rhodanese-related sulfurtransferase